MGREDSLQGAAGSAWEERHGSTGAGGAGESRGRGEGQGWRLWVRCGWSTDDGWSVCEVGEAACASLEELGCDSKLGNFSAGGL